MHGDDARALLATLPRDVQARLRAMPPGEVARLLASTWDRNSLRIALARVGILCTLALALAGGALLAT